MPFGLGYGARFSGTGRMNNKAGVAEIQSLAEGEIAH